MQAQKCKEGAEYEYRQLSIKIDEVQEKIRKLESEVI